MKKYSIINSAVAIFISRVFNRVVRLILVPIEIRYLGSEAFGVVGIYALLNTYFSVMDFGLSYTGNREIARILATDESEFSIRDVVKTFEIPYWVIGLIGGCTIFLISDWVSNRWIQLIDLGQGDVAFCISMMGVILFFQWPLSLYQGFLYGLKRHLLYSIYVTFFEIINLTVTIIVLIKYHEIKSFFISQAIIAFIQILFLKLFCESALRKISKNEKGYFRLDYLKRIWRYAFGINFANIIPLLVTRLDSLILSRLLPVVYLGYYSIAHRVPTIVGMISNSMLPASTPVLVEHFERKNLINIREIYLKQSNWLAFLSGMIAFPIAAFSFPILQLWTQSIEVANATWVVLSVIVSTYVLEITSNSCNQIAYISGNTKASIWIGILQGCILGVFSILLVPKLGILGAAISFSLTKIFRFLVYPNLVVSILEIKPWEWFKSTVPVLFIGGVIFFIHALLYYQYFRQGLAWAWIILLLTGETIYIFIMMITGMVVGLKTRINFFKQKIQRYISMWVLKK